MNRITGSYLVIDANGLLVDPVEYSPKYLAIKKELNEQLSPLTTGQPHMGACYSFWALKKKILKEKYQIEWRNPHELNPQVIFD